MTLPLCFMRNALRQNFDGQCHATRRHARPVDAEFGGRADGDAGPNGPEPWFETIASRLGEIDLAQIDAKTGNIKLE